MSELPAFTSQLALIDEDAPAGQILDLWERVQRHKRALREFDQELRQEFVRWLDANGELEVGDKRFYVKEKHTTRAIDKLQTAEALLTATSGDLQAFIDCLSSQPFLLGVSRKVVGNEAFAELFATEMVYDVGEGKPKKAIRELAVTDMRYVKAAT